MDFATWTAIWATQLLRDASWYVLFPVRQGLAGLPFCCQIFRVLEATASQPDGEMLILFLGAKVV